MTHDGAEVGVQFDFREQQGHLVGRFSSAQQRVLEYPFDEVTYAAQRLRVVLGGGDVVFDGTIARREIQGTFHDAEATGLVTDMIGTRVRRTG